MLDVNFAQISRFKATAKTARGALVLPIAHHNKMPDWLAAIDKDSYGKLKKAIASSNFTAKKGQILPIIAPEGLLYDQVLLLGLGKGKELDSVTCEHIGGKLLAKLNDLAVKKATIAIYNPKNSKISSHIIAVHMAVGAEMRAYKFDKYLTKKNDDNKPGPQSLTLFVDSAKEAADLFATQRHVLTGMFLTRDLVNEPGNILHPVSFAQRCKELSSCGIKVQIFGEAELEKMGCGALLGVGKGSIHESQMVVLQWNGADKNSKPLAFVGKGVTFDTGGISLKPANGMEEMKMDMGGAGAVVGLMKSLALRNAKVNAVGVIGLVENMPAGNAQRPGDIVTSLSGQTIEVLNTDAEGRLVLADCLWFTQDRFKPEFMVNLATLTGAIMVALGETTGGLFANDDKLARRLQEAGNEVGEKLWRMPLGEEYDKLLDCEVADMKNISSGRWAGSITAAQFLQRFVNDVPWAHLDIAGVATASKTTDICPKGASGFGVRLLDKFITKYYEGR